MILPMALRPWLASMPAITTTRVNGERNVFAQTTPRLTNQELKELVRRVDDNDESAIAEFRQQLQHPSVANRFGGDLPAIIQNALLNRIGLTDRHHRMALSAKLRQLRESLTLPTESLILQLLAERVAT